MLFKHEERDHACCLIGKDDKIISSTNCFRTLVLNVWAMTPWGEHQITFSQGLHIRYLAYQILTLGFITVKLQLWNSNKIVLWLGCHYNMEDSLILNIDKYLISNI